uniref:Interleukin-1 n=1 Tax=Tetraodon nigroviridis TaxID=99883 RepID=K9K563_TETNG|nr:IL-1Ra protein [Tetraodon nigroviridis]
MKDAPKNPFQSEDVLYPVSKESVLLRFHMEMWRKGDLEETKPAPKNGPSDNEGIKKSGCKTDDAENGKRRDLVVVSMKKTSIAVVRGRGCTSEGCSVNEVVLVAQSSKVTLVSRGSESFKQEKSSNVMIQHVASHYYLSLVSEKIISASPNPERITIYSYKTNEVEQGQYRGMPVVLNFTDSDCFLRCCQEDQRVFLQAEGCDKRRLRQISKSDESALSFVFYMKADLSKQRTFESALHPGWFIRVEESDQVGMAHLEREEEEYSFLFVIQK